MKIVRCLQGTKNRRQCRKLRLSELLELAECYTETVLARRGRGQNQGKNDRRISRVSTGKIQIWPGKNSPNYYFSDINNIVHVQNDWHFLPIGIWPLMRRVLLSSLTCDGLSDFCRGYLSRWSLISGNFQWQVKTFHGCNWSTNAVDIKGRWCVTVVTVYSMTETLNLHDRDLSLVHETAIKILQTEYNERSHLQTAACILRPIAVVKIMQHPELIYHKYVFFHSRPDWREHVRFLTISRMVLYQVALLTRTYGKLKR